MAKPRFETLIPMQSDRATTLVGPAGPACPQLVKSTLGKRR